MSKLSTITTLWLSTIILTSNLVCSNPEIFWIGQIQVIDKQQKKLQTYPKMYFDGTEVNVDKVGNFNFKANVNATLHILFTEATQVTACLEKDRENTLHCLQLKSDSHYKCYKLIDCPMNFYTTEDQLCGGCHAKPPSNSTNEIVLVPFETKLNNTHQIPLHTLLITVDPQKIACSFEYSNDIRTLLDHRNSGKLAAKLPGIVLRASEKNELDEALLKSVLGHVDLKPFHSIPQIKRIRFNNTLISLAAQ